MKTDEALVHNTAEGDDAARAELIRRHAGRVFATCLGVVRDPDDAEDLAQDALLKALTSLDRLEEGARFGSWLVSIARNLSLDHLRNRQRRRDLLASRTSSPGISPTPMPAPDHGIGLRCALDRLPEQHRLPLVLFYFDGRSTASVAQALDISRAGACTRLCRARRQLRQLLEANDD